MKAAVLHRDVTQEAFAEAAVLIVVPIFEILARRPN